MQLAKFRRRLSSNQNAVVLANSNCFAKKAVQGVHERFKLKVQLLANVRDEQTWVLSLLDWYKVNARPLPWRKNTESYRVWISEIMSQQTTITFLIPKYLKFMTVLPDVKSLANCSEETLRELWAGLGYYARARNLKKAAQHIVGPLKGQFPTTAKEWLEIPGCGPYTSAVVASVCYGDAAACVDGNVIRVVSRLCRLGEETWTRAGQEKISKFVTDHISHKFPGDFNQAMMELGATVCKKQNPECERCPVQKRCEAFRHGDVAKHPPAKPRKAMVDEKLVSLIFYDKERGQVAIGERQKGFLKKTVGFSVLRQPEAKALADSLQNMPSVTLRKFDSKFNHTITHHKIDAEVWMIEAPSVLEKNKTFEHFSNEYLAAQKWLDGKSLLESSLGTAFDKKAWQVVMRQKLLLFP